MDQFIKSIILESVDAEKLSKMVENIMIASKYDTNGAVKLADKYGIAEDVMRYILNDDKFEASTQEGVDAERLSNALYLTLDDDAKIRMVVFGLGDFKFFTGESIEYTPDGRLIIYLSESDLEELFSPSSDDLVGTVFSNELYETEFFDFYGLYEGDVDYIDGENMSKIKSILSKDGYSGDSDTELFDAIKKNDDLHSTISFALTDAMNGAFINKIKSDVKSEIEDFYGHPLKVDWNDEEHSAPLSLDLTDIVIEGSNTIQSEGYWKGQPVLSYSEIIGEGLLESISNSMDLPKVTIDDYRYYTPDIDKESFNEMLYDRLSDDFGV